VTPRESASAHFNCAPRADVARSRLPLAKVTVPEKFLRDWLIATLVFGLSALHFSFFYNYTLVNGDEGIILQGAQRILQGQVLYRDFFSLLTPGSYYWMAFFFKIFGSSILVGRAVLLVEGALLSVLTYLIARRVCSRWSAFLASVLVTLLGLPNRFLVLHNWDSTFWACLTLYSAVLFLQFPGRQWLFVTGFFGALTCLFDQSKGAGIVFGLALGFAILVITDRERLNNWKPGFFAAWAFGFALPFLVTFAYFGIEQGLSSMLADWFWPVRNYSAVNKTSYGFVLLSPADRAEMSSDPWPLRMFMMVVTAPWFFVPALPFVAAGSLIYWAPRKSALNSGENRRAYYVLISAAIVGLFLAIVATGRPDFTHFVYVVPMLFVLLAWIIDGQMLPSAIRRALPVLIFGLLLSSVSFGLAILTQPLNARYTLQTRRGTLKASHPDEILEYVQRHVPAGQTLLVYPYLPLYYYLTDTHNPTRYEYLMPAFHTPDQYQQVVRELKADQTRIIVFEPSFREKLPVGFPGASPEMLSAPDPVADYINSHYRKCSDLTSQDFWRFAAMVRKDLQCP
jgi:4-amino-4-deoxy-L-arabinose transferase-like glycosyltransferase